MQAIFLIVCMPTKKPSHLRAVRRPMIPVGRYQNSTYKHTLPLQITHNPLQPTGDQSKLYFTHFLTIDHHEKINASMYHALDYKLPILGTTDG